MANILITDLLEASAYLLRSLLRGRGHTVSIAVSVPEARAKLDTGLFDTLVIDMCDVSKDSLAVAKYANDILPGMPLVALTYREKEAKIKDVDLFGKVYRPIQGARVNAVCDQAITHALGLGARRESNRVSVNFPVSFSFAGKKFKARTTDISTKGFAIGDGEKAFSDAQLDLFTKKMAKEKLDVTWTPKSGITLKSTGRIAFVDQYRRDAGKMIGIVFDQLPEETKTYVDKLVKAA